MGLSKQSINRSLKLDNLLSISYIRWYKVFLGGRSGSLNGFAFVVAHRRW
jgi:hypothetical protein